MKLVDYVLNRITMYRLVLYYLMLLFGVAVFFSFFHILPYTPGDLLFSILLILGTSLVTNIIFAKTFGATTNAESVYITAFILALIVNPVSPSDVSGIGFVVFVSLWAMASKYILALGKKHILNPAAFGVALGALVLSHSATWWVGGNFALLPFVFIGGLLILRKLKKSDLAITFIVVALLVTALTTSSGNAVNSISQTLFHSSIFFLAFVMLTEPLTMPPNRWSRIIYGTIVGFLFAPNTHIGSFYFTPELALLIGNIFSYIVSPRGRFSLTLLEKRKIAADTFEFVFAPDRPFSYLPGQYLEWTLGHRNKDTRGNRRFFTIASAPGEDTIRLGVKFYKDASSFKRALWAMQKWDVISASRVEGDFILPNKKNKKLVFIAGGIGITPFRSMVQHLIDTHDARSIVLLYSNKTAAEIAYKELFDTAAKAINMKTVYALTNETTPLPGYYHGTIDQNLILKQIPDFKERVFYISGPQGMVEAFKKVLREIGVARSNIKTDYFPGFA